MCRVGLACLTMTAALAAQQPVLLEHGSYTINLLLHAIGTEEYRVEKSAAGRILRSTANTNDRGTTRTVTSTLAMSADYSATSDWSRQSSSPGDSWEHLTEISRQQWPRCEKEV